MRKRLRPLALQATAAERAEKLGREIAGLRARVAQLDLAESGSRRAEAEQRRDAVTFSKRGAQGRLEGVLGDRARAEEELSDAAGRREAAVAARYRLQSGVERLELRMESASALVERFGAETPAADEPAGQTELARLELEAVRAAESARTAERERIALAERAALVRERMRALEQALAEQEGLPPAARALAEDGARLALATLDVEPGAERAVAAALRTRAAAVIADDPAVGLALLQRARAAGLGSLTVLAGRSPQDLVGEFPVVMLDTLLDVTTPSVTPEGFGYDPGRGELWFVGETAEAVLLELQGRRTALAAEVAALDAAVATATEAAAEAAERARVSGGCVRPGTEASCCDDRRRDAEPARRPGDGAASRHRRCAPRCRALRGAASCARRRGSDARERARRRAAHARSNRSESPSRAGGGERRRDRRRGRDRAHRRRRRGRDTAPRLGR